MDDMLEIAGKRFRSRLMMGTGKWRTAEEFTAATTAMATVLGRPSIEGLAYHPGLYQVIRT